MRRAYDYWQNQPGCFPSARGERQRRHSTAHWSQKSSERTGKLDPPLPPRSISGPRLVAFLVASCVIHIRFPNEHPPQCKSHTKCRNLRLAALSRTSPIPHNNIREDFTPPFGVLSSAAAPKCNPALAVRPKNSCTQLCEETQKCTINTSCQPTHRRFRPCMVDTSVSFVPYGAKMRLSLSHLATPEVMSP